MKTKLTFVLLLCLPLLLTAQVRVIENGNVGVGVDSPSEKLDINGNTTMSGSATITDLNGGYHQLKGNTFDGTYGTVINYPGEVVRTSGQPKQGAIVVALEQTGVYWVNINLLLFDYQHYDHAEVTISGIHYPDGRFRIIGREIISAGDWNHVNHTDMIGFGKRNDNVGVIVIGDFTDLHGGGAGPAIYSIKNIQVSRQGFKSENVKIYLDDDDTNYTIEETRFNKLHAPKIVELITEYGNANADFITFKNQATQEIGRFYYNKVNGALGNGNDFNISTSGGRDFVLRAANANINLSSTRVGIGTYAPTERLHVLGNIRASGSVFASCGTLSCSDIRYKKNFKKIESPLTKIQRIDGLYYDWKKEEFPERGFDDNTYLGFKAQEVEQQFPEMVHTDAEGYKSVDYSRMTVVLLEGMKEQQAQIAALQQENKALQNQMSKVLKYMDGQVENTDTSVTQNRN